MTFTPNPADQATADFFTSNGVELDEYGRLVFAHIDAPTWGPSAHTDAGYEADLDDWQHGIVETSDGIRYPLEVRNAECGARCRCAAEVRLTDDTPKAVRRVTVTVPADRRSRAIIGTWQDPDNARLASDEDLDEMAQTAAVLAFENAEEFCTDIPRYRDILNRVIDGPIASRDEIAETIGDAIVLDRPLDSDPVEDWWSDVTLTTVVAPHLAHIAEKMAEEGWDEEVAALNKAINIVHNWRG